MQFKTLCKTLWNKKNKQWLVSLWLIWHLFSRSALYHTEPAAPCLFPSCRRRWRSCICTKTKAGSQTEHSFPHMDKAQTQTHFFGQSCVWLVLNWYYLLATYFRRPAKDSFVFQAWLCDVFHLIFVTAILLVIRLRNMDFPTEEHLVLFWTGALVFWC